MRGYINLDSQFTQASPIFPGTWQFIGRRGKSEEISIGFIRSNNSATIDIGAGNLRITVRSLTSSQRYDETATLSSSSFTKITEDGGTWYKVFLPIINGLIDKALGVDPIPRPEIVDVACNPDIGGAGAGRYLSLYSSAGAEIRVWQFVGGSGSAPPTPAGGRLVQVTYATASSATTIAAAFATAFASDTDYTASASTGIVTFTSKANAAFASNAYAGNTGYAVSITQAGGVGLGAADVDSSDFVAVIAYDFQGNRNSAQRFIFTVENDFEASAGSPATPWTGTYRAGSLNIPNGQQYIDLTWSPAYPDTNWFLRNCAIRNTTDVSPSVLFVGTMSSKTTTGCRLWFNGATDSVNYVAEFVVERFG